MFNFKFIFMEQKIFKYKYKVNQSGEPEVYNLDEEVERLISGGWTIKQISTCTTNKYFVNRDTEAYLHVFLLADKPE